MGKVADRRWRVSLWKNGRVVKYMLVVDKTRESAKRQAMAQWGLNSGHGVSASTTYKKRA